MICYYFAKVQSAALYYSHIVTKNTDFEGSSSIFHRYFVFLCQKILALPCSKPLGAYQAVHFNLPSNPQHKQFLNEGFL